MVAGVKYESFIQKLVNGDLDLFGTTEALYAALHSDAPVAATDDELADLTQPTGTGYTAGGTDTQNDSTRTGGTVTLTTVDHTWTAGASDWTAFRYLAIYDNDITGDPLWADYDYGSNVTLLIGETFTANYGASLGTFV
jgi:hypothetical protein